MEYREERKQSILNYFIDNGIAFETDGKHAHVINKKYTDINIVDSVKKIGYKTIFNESGTIIAIGNSFHILRLDSRANNITSSSMLSACFFAILLDHQLDFRSIIQNLFNKQFNEILSIDGNIDVELEWIDKDGDQSHIDALISFNANGVKYRLFTEVKYCENAYGPRKRYDNDKMLMEEKLKLQAEYIEDTKRWYEYHNNRMNIDGYLRDCSSFESCLASNYVKRYQIIRNVSHSNLNTHDYCLFLLAKGNIDAVVDIEEGLAELSIQNGELIKNRVAVLFFEDVVSKESDLYQKYFK